MEKVEQLPVVFLVSIVILFIINSLLTGPFDYLIDITQFGVSIAGFISSIKLVREKKSGIGKALVALFSIILLVSIVAFILYY